MFRDFHFQCGAAINISIRIVFVRAFSYWMYNCSYTFLIIYINLAESLFNLSISDWNLLDRIEVSCYCFWTKIVLPGLNFNPPTVKSALYLPGLSRFGFYLYLGGGVQHQKIRRPSKNVRFVSGGGPYFWNASRAWDGYNGKG